MRRNHILYGDHETLGRPAGGHLHGVGRPGKSEFPASWGEKEIIDAIRDVARNPDRPPDLRDNGMWFAEGTRNGVVIAVWVASDGSVDGGYPVCGAPGSDIEIHRNPRAEGGGR